MNKGPDSSLRIVLADDHPIFLLGLRTVLEQDVTLQVVAEADGPGRLMETLNTTPCDLLISDFAMPVEGENDGLRLLHKVRRDWPQLPVLVVTMLNNAALFRAMLDSGVRGLLGKGSLASELPTAIAHLRDGKPYIGRSIEQTLREAEELQGPAALSPKELEVIRLLASGRAVGEIAQLLNRSKQTVSAQKVSAMRKLGLDNDAALFIYLQEHGLS